MQKSNNIYKKLTVLASEIKENFREKGIVLPRKIKGNIKIGNYTVVKDFNFFSVVNQKRDVIYDKINLAQTAVLIANELALGRKDNDDLIKIDQEYGFNLFETENFQRLMKRSLYKNDWIRYHALTVKKEKSDLICHNTKMLILARFEKLSQLR